MKKRITALLLTLSMCFSLCVVNAAAATPERIDRTNGRSDGTWLFPAPSKYFDQFTDWAGCPGMGKCKLCGKSHSSDGWGDTSHTGQFKGNGHNGFDIATPSGTSIYAAADGTVRFAGYSSDGRGNTVVIEHPIDETWSYYSYYQHLKSISVKAGKTVSAGTEIAKSGNSGGNYGAHLHFGIVMGKKGKKKSVLSYIGSLECKGFLKKMGLVEGSILVNPSTSSIFPKGQKGVTQPLGYHSGSVAYTFDKSKVSVGPNGTAGKEPMVESTLAFKDVNAPTTLKQGEYFSLKGTVSSNYDISSVKGEIVSTSGEVVCTYTQKPNAASFQLLNSKLDHNMTFNKLSPGEYTLRYIAEDMLGKNVDWNSFPFSVTAKGKKNYDPDKALSYAAKHWNDGKGLCAEFVSNCLKAGGCDVWSVNCGDLLRGLKSGGWGTASEATVAQDGHVYVQDNQGKLGKGDLLIYYCDRENSLYEYTHTVIISGMADDGQLLCYAHNDPKNNAKFYANNCGYCGGSLTAVYAVHMNGVTPYTAEFSQPEKEPPRQQPDSSSESPKDTYAPQGMEDDIFFDAEIYYALHPDLAFTFGKNGEQLYEHWINYGIEEGRTASLLFDARWYLEFNPDVAETYGSENYAGAYDHYLRYGIYEGRSGSPFFNARFYLDRYQDLTEEYGDDVFAAARHFVTNGIYEERTASEYFSVFAYAEKNPDVAETFPAVKDRFIHYIRQVQYGTEERPCT